MHYPDFDDPPPSVREAIDAIVAGGFDAPDANFVVEAWANAVLDLSKRKAEGDDPAEVAQAWLGEAQERYPRWRPDAPDLRWALMRVYRYILDHAVAEVRGDGS